MKKTSFEEFMNDCKHGVYNFTKDGKCSSCGNCCTAILPVTKEELKTIWKYVKAKRIKPVASRKDVDFDMSCPFRNEEKRICMIYDKRPSICSIFKCDKWQKQIEMERDSYTFDSRYTVVNFRDIWG